MTCEYPSKQVGVLVPKVNGSEHVRKSVLKRIREDCTGKFTDFPGKFKRIDC